MTTCYAVQNVGFQHGIKRDTAQLNTVVLQNTAIVFEVLPHLQRVVVFQNRLQQFQYAFARELLRCVR